MTRPRKESDRAQSVAEWIPNIVQISGVLLAFVLVGASIAGHLQDAAVLGPIALGMMLGKYVSNAAHGRSEPPDEP